MNALGLHNRNTTKISTNRWHAIKSSVYKFFIHLVEAGVEKQKDISLKKNILVSNLFYLFYIVLSLISSLVIYFFTVNKSLGIASFLVSFVLCASLYFNHKGFFLASKLFFLLFGNISLVAIFCCFSHKTQFYNLYLIYCVIIPVMFSSQEKKWIFITEASFIISFVLETTRLVNYMPALNLLRDAEKVNFIGLTYQTMLLVAYISIFVYIFRRSELQLLRNRKELEESRKQLLLQNEDLQTFSMAASQSLRNCVYITKFLLKRIEDDANLLHEHDSQKKSIVIIHESLSQIELLVTGLFSYQRIIEIKEDFETFDVTQELNLVKKNALCRYPDALIQLPENVCMIKTNRMLFSVIMQNLVDNGIKYNTAQHKIININIHHSATSIDFIVYDNGIGIKKESWEKIFEPFKRLKQVNADGNGLGLPGARRAAERIDADLICKESSDKGTVFALSIHQQ